MRRLTLVTALAAAAAALALAPSRSEAHPCVSGNEVWFRAADGTLLVGHRFGGPRPGSRTAVVLGHMSDGDLCTWVPYARVLATKGFFVFPFDFRGHGLSKGRPRYGRLGSDVAAAVRAVRRLGARKVVIGGASLGGIASLVAAPTIRPAADGVFAVSAPAGIPGGLDARPFVPRLSIPTLYLVAARDRNDSYDFARDARALHAATGTGEKRVVVVSGALHGTELVDASGAVRRELEHFLRDPAGAVP
jgi:pimeloyl-ACP methyl ester carboxylesterase